MPSGANTKIWARTVLILALMLTAGVAFRAPAGLSLTTGKGGVAFEFKAAFVRIAFDFGQKCSISDRCGGLLAVSTNKDSGAPAAT
jgi:hypothetical protein